MSQVELIRRAEVLRITGLRKSTLYALMKRRDDPFPPNYPTSERGRAWVRAEVESWCERRRNVEKKPTPIEEAASPTSTVSGPEAADFGGFRAVSC